MPAQRVRTAEEGYIDGFNAQMGLARVHSAISASEGDWGGVVNRFFRAVPKLESVKAAAILALREYPDDIEKTLAERDQAMTSLFGNAVVGLALESQGFYQGLNRRNIVQASEAYRSTFRSGEMGADYLRSQSEPLFEVADHFPGRIGIEENLRDSYWHGVVFSYFFARQIGIDKAVVMSN